MTCLKLVGMLLTEVDDPVAAFGGDYDHAIRKAGYRPEIMSLENPVGVAHLTVYKAQRASVPLFYIDIMGCNEQLVCLVADDVIHLISTLRQVQALIQVIAMQQQAGRRDDTAGLHGQFLDSALG